MVSGRESMEGETSLQVMDPRGEILDQIRAGRLDQDSETYRELESLHEAARRQALNVESHLDLLLREIDGTASARLVGTEHGEMRVSGETWQPMQALIEHLEPGVAAGLAPWQPGARASRSDAEKIQKALGQMRANPGGMDLFLSGAGFTRKTTPAGTTHTMGIFSLPKREIERLDEFLKHCRGFTVEGA